MVALLLRAFSDSDGLAYGLLADAAFPCFVHPWKGPQKTCFWLNRQKDWTCDLNRVNGHHRDCADDFRGSGDPTPAADPGRPTNRDDATLRSSHALGLRTFHDLRLSRGIGGSPGVGGRREKALLVRTAYRRADCGYCQTLCPRTNSLRQGRPSNASAARSRWVCGCVARRGACSIRGGHSRRRSRPETWEVRNCPRSEWFLRIPAVLGGCCLYVLPGARAWRGGAGQMPTLVVAEYAPCGRLKSNIPQRPQDICRRPLSSPTAASRRQDRRRCCGG